MIRIMLPTAGSQRSFHCGVRVSCLAFHELRYIEVERIMFIPILSLPIANFSTSFYFLVVMSCISIIRGQ